VCNKKGDNIMHATLQGLPKVKNEGGANLRDMLELFDPSLRSHLFLQRNNLHEAGVTPLHSWIESAIQHHQSTYNRGYVTNRYKTHQEIVDVLNLVLEYSQGAELEMLNGAGDTCLHTCVRYNASFLIKALLEYKHKLMYRENAVGRTAAEVARDRLTRLKFKSPTTISLSNSGKSAASLVSRGPESFIEESGKKEEGTSREQEVWNNFRDFMERFPDKRRLVSLNEANDVARRLGEKYNGSRYFSVRSRGDDNDSEDGEDKNKDDVLDCASTRRAACGGQAWLPRST
jgi:hypothetical protein